jgi:hypothetical protein
MKPLALFVLVVSVIATSAAAVDVQVDSVVLQTDAAFDTGLVVENPMLGQQLVVGAYLSFSGGDTIPPFGIRFYHNGSPLCSFTFPEQDSRPTFAYCFSLWAVEAGVHTFSVVVDEDGFLAEDNESNNMGSETYTIEGNGGGDPPGLFEFALGWTGGLDDVESLLSFLGGGGTGNPTPTLTPTPEPPTPTPTLSPTPGASATPTQVPGDTFDFADYFPLAGNSNWHYTGVNGGSTEDDFAWVVEANTQPVANGEQATRIRTDTDEPSDDRNMAVDFWHVDGTGQLFFDGTFLPKAISILIANVPSQNIILSDPVLIGRAGMKVGDVVEDEGAAMIMGTVFGSPQNVNATVQSRVEVTDRLPSFVTPLGTFTDVLRVEVGIDASVFGASYTFLDNTFFLKEGVGLIAHDQEPDPDDAQIQAIDGGAVGGVTIVAN